MAAATESHLAAFYLILELLSGTSFNAILYKQPVPLEDLKPHLYETVKSILKNYRED